MLRRASRFAANNAIALLALFLALGGASYAATGALSASNPTFKACVGESHVVVLKTGRKPCGKHKKTIVWNEQGPSGAKGATGAAGAAGAAGANGFSALSTLPSGASESGDFTVADGETVAENVNESITFPIPLAAPIDGAHAIYVTTGSAPNCPGIGQAARGFLCVYSVERKTIALEFIYSYDSGAHALGTGRFGFNMEWVPIKTGSFDTGAWTVTAP
jgi:hypothetical protein